MAQGLAPTVGRLGNTDPVTGHDASRRGDGVYGIGFAVVAPDAALRPQHLVHGVARVREPARERRAVRVGALHAHPGAQGRIADHVD